jgi:hypothetical protein
MFEDGDLYRYYSFVSCDTVQSGWALLTLGATYSLSIFQLLS